MWIFMPGRTMRCQVLTRRVVVSIHDATRYLMNGGSSPNINIHVAEDINPNSYLLRCPLCAMPMGQDTRGWGSCLFWGPHPLCVLPHWHPPRETDMLHATPLGNQFTFWKWCDISKIELICNWVTHKGGDVEDLDPHKGASQEIRCTREGVSGDMNPINPD